MGDHNEPKPTPTPDFKLPWYLEVLKKEWAVIRGAPFIFAVLTLAIGVLWYVGFSTALTLRKNTIDAYKERYGVLPSTDKSAPQVLFFDNDPNDEKMIPQTTGTPAVAYSTKTGHMYFWDTNTARWFAVLK